jgi:hypothetical protein
LIAHSVMVNFRPLTKRPACYPLSLYTVPVELLVVGSSSQLLQYFNFHNDNDYVS